MKSDNDIADKKAKTHKFLKQLGIVFLDIIIFIAICYFVGLGISYIQKLNKNAIKQQYVGTWKLKNPKENYSFSSFNENYNYETNELEKTEYKKNILVDKILNFEAEDVYYGMGLSICPHYDQTKPILERCDDAKEKVFLSHVVKDYIGINFISDTGDALMICFKLENKNILNQVKCKGIATDEYNPNGFSENDGINEILDITYEKEN